MNVYQLHDVSNEYVINILKNEFGQIKDENIVKNYHPDYEAFSGNIFYILRNGRYSTENGKYYVIIEDNKFISSAGWNKYTLDENIALLLTRMYVNPKFRNKFYIGKYLLADMISDTSMYSKRWITCNEYNKSIYNWFVRVSKNKMPSVGNKWPEIYKKFKPIGIKTIYFTDQYVIELNE